MRGRTEETVLVRQIPFESFEMDVHEEPSSMMADADPDQCATTVRILPADTVLENYSDGAPNEEIIEVLHFRQQH